jgi:hypothetical protein
MVRAVSKKSKSSRRAMKAGRSAQPEKLKSVGTRSVVKVLIPEEAAPLFRNDGAPLFRSIAARRSDQSSPPIPG